MAGRRTWISAVLLAAGSSTRFSGPTPKQLLSFDGEPLVRRLARGLTQSAADEVIVVSGHRRVEVETALRGLPVTIVPNPRFADGLSTSVRTGLAAVSPLASAACFVPCDQPLLGVETLDAIFTCYRRGAGDIVVPWARGRRGAPVLFDRALFAELEGVEGDQGGRQVVARHPDRVFELELEDERPLLDIDSMADLEKLRSMA